MSDLVIQLRRWAAARERRNGPDGHGKTGTHLLHEAADKIAALERDNRTLRDALAEIEPLLDAQFSEHGWRQPQEKVGKLYRALDVVRAAIASEPVA